MDEEDALFVDAPPRLYALAPLRETAGRTYATDCAPRMAPSLPRAKAPSRNVSDRVGIDEHDAPFVDDVLPLRALAPLRETSGRAYAIDCPPRLAPNLPRAKPPRRNVSHRVGIDEHDAPFVDDVLPLSTLAP